MIKKIITTAVVSTALLIGANNMAQSKEINLECTYNNGEKDIVDLVYLNTDSKRAGLDGKSITLYNDNASYWFTSYYTPEPYMEKKHQIDRNNLSYTSQTTVLDLVISNSGQCAIVESKAKI